MKTHVASSIVLGIPSHSGVRWRCPFNTSILVFCPCVVIEMIEMKGASSDELWVALPIGLFATSALELWVALPKCPFHQHFEAEKLSCPLPVQAGVLAGKRRVAAEEETLAVIVESWGLEGMLSSYGSPDRTF